MIKWIGQHIWDFVSRFRNDVYLENIADGTVENDKFLGLDNTGKIVKETVSASAGITVTDNSDNAKYPLVFHDDSNNLLDDTDNFEYNPSKSTMYIESAATVQPVINLKNTYDDANSPLIKFYSQRADDTSTVGQDGDDLGALKFYGKNDAGGGSGTVESIEFANIIAEIQDASDSAEKGRLTLSVASHDGEIQPGLKIDSGGGEDVVNVTIGNETASTTTVAGNLNASGEDHAFTSATNGKPSVTISSGGASQGGGHINFKRTATGQDNQNLGDIYFIGNNDADEEIYYAHINGDISDASDGAEEGSLNLFVQSQGVLRTGFSCVGNGANVVDTTIGTGTTSVATIAGGISIGGIASMPKRKFAIPSDGAGNHDGDIVYIGTNTGGTATVAGQIYYYASTGLWVLTDADDPSTATGWLAVALGDDPDVDGMLVRGMVDLETAIVGTEALGSILYLDKATPGAATTAAPTATGDIVRVIGYALTTGDANKIWFSPDNTWVEHV